MEKSSTEMQHLQDELGQSDRHIPYPKGAFEAFYNWELLQRGVVHNNKRMSTDEIAELCGVTSRWVRMIVVSGWTSATEYNK